jgi:hypothetical protein
MIADDLNAAHSVVFQGYSLGYIGSFYLSIFRGTLVSREDECALLLLQALKTASPFKSRYYCCGISERRCT